MKKLNQTAIKSLNTILQSAKDGKLKAIDHGRCMYYDKEYDRFCAIGCLLSHRMIRELIDEGCNKSTSARELYEAYPSMPRITGLSIEDAMVVQELHDLWAGGSLEKRQFVAKIQGVLDNRLTFDQLRAFIQKYD